MVEVHCVRDNGNSTHQWLIGSDWLRVRVRDSSIRLGHRGCQPFSRKSGKLPFFSIPFIVFTLLALFLLSLLLESQLRSIVFFFFPSQSLSSPFFFPLSSLPSSAVVTQIGCVFFVLRPMYCLRPSCSLPSPPPNRKLRSFVCVFFVFRPI